MHVLSLRKLEKNGKLFDWNVRLFYAAPNFNLTENRFVESFVHITIYYRVRFVSRASWIYVKYPKQNMHLIEQMFPQKT